MINPKPQFKDSIQYTETSQINQQMTYQAPSQSTQSQQLPIPPSTGQYMTTPMPPPVDPLLVSQQIQSQIQQQGLPIPEQNSNTSNIIQNQTSQIQPYVSRQTTEFEYNQNQTGQNSGSQIFNTQVQYNQDYYQQQQQQLQSGFNPLQQSGFNSLQQSGIIPLQQSGFNPLQQSGIIPQYYSGFNPQQQSGFNPQQQSGFIPQQQSGINLQQQSGINPLYQNGINPQQQSGIIPQQQSGFIPQQQSGIIHQSQSGIFPQQQSGINPLQQSGFIPQQQSQMISPTQIFQQQNNFQELQQSSNLIFNTQDLQNSSSSQSLENSKIISHSMIKEMIISSNTHNMITIEENTNEFLIQPFDEKLKKEENKHKQLVNSNIFIIQNKNTKIPDYEFEDRLCNKHNQPIEKICAEQECKENKNLLLCKECARQHKGHNQFDIPEALFLIQKNQTSLDDNIQIIETIKIKAFQQFKMLKSNITWQLKELEDQLSEGFEKFKQYLQEKKSTYNQALNDIQSGGLSKMDEKVNYIFDQGLFLEANQNTNESQYKQLAEQLDQVYLSMRRFEQLIEDNKQDQEIIKLNNVEILIESQKINNLNDLYFQIKNDALKQKFTNILDEELLLLQNNKAIRLKGNFQEINLKEQKNIQIISYIQI